MVTTPRRLLTLLGGSGEAESGAQSGAEALADGRLAREEVEALHRRFAARIERTVESALARAAEAPDPPEPPKTPEAERRAALRDYALALSRARRAVTASALAPLAGLDPEAIDRRRAALPDPESRVRDHAEVARAIDQAQGRRLFEGSLFAPGEDRIYLPLSPEMLRSPTRERVAARLREMGHEGGIDYVGGYVADGRGGKLKIGRLLAREDPELAESFARDPARAGELLAVISRDPVDIATMSTGRGWESCLSEDGVFFDRYMPDQIRQGTLVAYLARDGDPDLHAPLARLHIKPYRNRAGQILLRPGQTYGLGHPGFAETVGQWLDDGFNANKIGRFEMPQTVYPDRMAAEVTRTPRDMSTPELLDAVGAKWRWRGDRISVRGSLDLSNMGLTRLPDMRHVTVHGRLNLAGNRLRSLTGCPARVQGSFSARNNRLTSLAGGPEEIGYAYDVSGNELASLAGAPQRVPGGFHADRNALETLEGGPQRVGGSVHVAGNRLVDLRGAPTRMGGGVLHCRDNPISSYAGRPRSFRAIDSDHGRHVGAAAIPARLDGPPAPVEGFWARLGERLADSGAAGRPPPAVTRRTLGS